MEVNDAILFLNRYGEHLPRLGFQSPHTCRHCDSAIVDLTVKKASFTCMSCFWNGLGETTIDGQYICSKCGHPFDPDVAALVEARYIVRLDHHLSGAIDAALTGCELYRWIIGALARTLSASEAKKAIHTTTAACCRFELSALSIHDPDGADGNCLLSCDFVCIGNSKPSDDLSSTAGNELPARRTHISHIPAWTTASDPVASQHIAARPYQQDVQSKRSIKFAQDCLQACLDSHIWCRTDQISHLLLNRKAETKLPSERVDRVHIPTRMVTIMGHGSDCIGIRLVESSDGNEGLMAHISAAGFMALSYCWGGDQPVKLTRDTYSTLKGGLKLSNLPQTLQDAVWVADAMGFRHLWIDCLCILQDDDNDKALEVSRMASYYGRATLTLCAASAPRCTDGFLDRREDSPFATGPVRLQLRSKESRENAGALYLVEEADAPVEPTASRGWTLQESLLSRRILIFGRRQLYWSCVNSFAGCGGSKVTLTDRIVPGAQSLLVDGIYPVGSLIDNPTSNQWQVIIKEYTRRSLGWAADKLLAVSALAAHMVAMSQKRGEEPLYAAGLLVNQREPSTWLRQLLWHPEAPDLTRRASDYRAPSWSWASVDGPLQIRSWRANLTTYATVESSSVQVSVPTALYGSVAGGHIVLAARTRLIGEVVGTPQTHCRVIWASEGKGSEVDIHTDYGPWGAFKGADDHWALVLLADSPQDRIAIEAELAVSNNLPGGRFLLVGMLSLDIGSLAGVEGIIVEPLAVGSSGELHIRRGSFQLRGGRQVEGRSSSIHRFFVGAENKTIHVV
ncbi:heterokaryon incompatibility protein-domain-containing protein [Podospora didyma]|uniref:Heterokaryon incompatibility protein-domain-containing protein n=1 Tax=Podospora didyma TaxID=330526 RepID=A0AAE0KAS1_9PEZI|nr:heterokaryon incompatibility protein-domain-containing protein [Podospora didyma]